MRNGSLNPRDKQILARLVYRAALWVSVSDEDGGSPAQNLEERVLKRTLQDMYRKYPNGSDEREILGIALANSGKWRYEWSDNLIELVQELKAVQPVIPHSVGWMMMTIAKDVATAFRERSLVSSWIVQLGMMIRSMFSKLNPDLSPEEYANISESEKAALYELAEALGITEFHI